MKPKDLIKILESEGWYVDRIQGSHCIMKHPKKKGRPVIPYHNKDLASGTFKNILRQAGLD